MLISKSPDYKTLIVVLGLYLLTGCSLSGKGFGNWTVRLPEDGDYFMLSVVLRQNE